MLTVNASGHIIFEICIERQVVSTVVDPLADTNTKAIWNCVIK